MKQFTRLISLVIAFSLAFTFANAQSVMTKAQTLGLKTNTVDITVDKDVMSVRDILLEEGFDGDFPPAGWSVINFNATNNWFQGNPTDHPFSEIDPNSTASALVAYIAEDLDEWLITPVIDAGGETPLKVEWYAGVSGPWLNPGATIILNITTDGGTTWTPLWNAIDVIDPAAEWAWNFVSTDLNDYTDTPFQLGWQYVGNDGDLAGIDGVVVKYGYDYIYETDFEDLVVGDYLAETGDPDFWTTWSDEPGGTEDALITDAQSNSPTKSVIVNGTNDMVFKMGDKTSGKYQFNVKYWVESGFGGYLNLQHFESPGIEWATEIFFATTGDAWIFAGDPSEIFFSYTPETWMQLEFIIDLDNDWAEFYLDGTLVTEWQFSLKAKGDPGALQLGGANLYAGAPEGETSQYYFDDVEYIVLVEGTTPPIIDVDDSPVSEIVEIGASQDNVFDIGNSGVDDLNYDVTVTYPMGNKALAQEPTGIHTVKDLNAVMSATSVVADNSEISDRDVELSYCGDPTSAIGSANDYEWRVAARFPADMVEPYIGMELSSVEVWINDPGIEYKLQVYGMGKIYEPGPGELLAEQAFNDNGAGQFVSITLDNPIFIEGGDIWVGYWVSATGGLFTPGVDEGPVNLDGDWMAAGPGWGHLSDNAELQFNWYIKAFLTGDGITQWLSTDIAEGTLGEGVYEDITMTMDATGLESDIYTGKIVIRSNDLENDIANKTVLMNVVVGIGENGEKETISVYPNPASDYLRISTNGEISNVRIVNTIGQVVLEQNVGLNDVTISTTDLSQGVYFVNIETKTGTTTQKIIIE